MNYLLSIIIYLGFGFLVLYLVGDGASIEWSNPGELALVILWPFYLIWQFFKIVLIVFVAIVIVTGGCIAIEKLRGN